MAFQPIRKFLPKGYKNSSSDVVAARVLALWRDKAKQLLPNDLATTQTPKSFCRGVLTLEVENATIGSEISHHSPRIIKALNQALGQEAVERVIFRVK
jgi:hypothetical protein